jgi:hypothetical protein
MNNSSVFHACDQHFHPDDLNRTKLRSNGVIPLPGSPQEILDARSRQPILPIVSTFSSSVSHQPVSANLGTNTFEEILFYR